jgi:hypothetical protein
MLTVESRCQVYKYSLLYSVFLFACHFNIKKFRNIAHKCKNAYGLTEACMTVSKAHTALGTQEGVCWFWVQWSHAVRWSFTSGRMNF